MLLKSSIKLCCLAAVFLLLMIGRAGAASKDLPGFLDDISQPGAAIQIEAGRIDYDPEGKLIFAAGGVRLTRGLLTVESEWVAIDLSGGDIMAEGEVRFSDGENEFAAESLQYNFNTGQGTLVGGDLRLKMEGYALSAKKLEKTGPRTFVGSDVSLTTCAGKPPAWSFSARRFKLTVEGYASMQGTTFRILDVPVLYLPWGFFPVKISRQTGFLPPRFEYSDSRGFRMDNYFYWAISPSEDATFNLDLMSEAGIGGGLEFRYLVPRDGAGRAYFYNIKEAKTDEWRWIGNLRHDQYLDRTLYLKADLRLAGDRYYYRDYGENLDLEAQPQLESVVFLTKNWPASTFTSRAVRRQPLTPGPDTAVQTWPALELDGAYLTWGKLPLRFSLDSQLENLWREEQGEENLPRGQRVFLHPSVSLPLSYRGYFSLLPSVTFEETLYRLDEDENNREKHRELWRTEVWAGTSLSRVYNTAWERYPAWRHYLEPQVKYLYLPEKDQSRLPYFDSYDRVDPRHQIAFSLVNRVNARQQEDFLNFLFLEVGTAWYLDYRQADEESGKDLFLDYRVQPESHLTWGGEGNYALGAGRQVASQYHYLDWREDQWNRARIGFSYKQDDYNYVEAEAVKELNDWLAVRGGRRYSLQGWQYLEDRLGVIYRHQCWQASLTYSRRPGEDKVELWLSLSGIGEISRLGKTLP